MSLRGGGAPERDAAVAAAAPPRKVRRTAVKSRPGTPPPSLAASPTGEEVVLCVSERAPDGATASAALRRAPVDAAPASELGGAGAAAVAGSAAGGGDEAKEALKRLLMDKERELLRLRMLAKERQLEQLRKRTAAPPAAASAPAAPRAAAQAAAAPRVRTPAPPPEERGPAKGAADAEQEAKDRLLREQRERLAAVLARRKSENTRHPHAQAEGQPSAPGVASPAADALAASAEEQPRQDTAEHASVCGHRRGDRVEVWSNSRGQWLPGIVKMVFPEDAEADGYAMRRNTIKVEFAAGYKYIVEEEIPVMVRRTQAAEPEPRVAPAAEQQADLVVQEERSRSLSLGGASDDSEALNQWRTEDTPCCEDAPPV